MLLYIMSRPHSGSTILDILLGNSAAVASIGQLISDMGKPHNPCACGETVGGCPFWRGVRARVEAEGIAWDEAVRLSMGQGHVTRFPKTLMAGAGDAGLGRLATITHAIERAIVAESGKPVVCDSSKEPTRALFLLKRYPDARLIHLVRDPRGAIASHYWRLKDKGFYHFLRKDYRQPWLGPLFLALAAASWSVGNALFEVGIRHDPKRVLRLRYEDLRDDPKGTLGRVGAFLGLALDDVALKLDAGETLSAGHLIGGNDVRLEKGLRFDPVKETKRRRLPGWVEAMTVAFCWPLMRRYGYSIRRRSLHRTAAGAAGASGAS
ncbi:MAG: sulfotransferase [Geminicoccaceae bacterium]|nr:sulfotransferase [Geminicoccaceae bacterium]